MKYDLSSCSWKLKGTAPFVPLRENSMETGAALEGITDWIDTKVPGGVTTALYQAGYIEHPYFGMNSLKCEWIENKWWIYETVFTAPDFRGDEIRLEFEGVDYECIVYWNNQMLGEHEGMYEPFSFDVTKRCSSNEEIKLRVLIKHAPDEMGQIGKTSETFTQKSRFNYKWDFGTRLVNLGIWQGVKLVYIQDAELVDLFVQSQLDENGVGEISVKAQINEISQPKKLTCKMICSLNGVEKGIAEQVISADELSLSVTLPNVSIWYPNGMGEQPMYDITISLYHGKQLLDQKTHRLGIRKIEFCHNENSPLSAQKYLMVVNGVKTYIKGVNITPLDHMYGDVPKERIEYTLSRAVEMNCNLVRVWGGGIIETEQFYDYCDKHGLLIWQEFIQSSSGIDNIPSKKPRFIELLKKSAEAAVKQKRNHTCLVIWSGGNELMDENRVPCTDKDENIAILKAIVSKLDPGRKFLPTSASGLSEFIHPVAGNSHDVHGWWQYQGNPNHYSFYSGSDSLLHSEFGCDGMSSLQSLQKILPKDELHPVKMTENTVWRFHGDWWCTYERDNEIFGEISNIESYIACSQWMQAEGLRYILEANRRRQFSNSGSIVWQLNEPWPNISCTNLLEYHGSAKMAYYWAKTAFSACSPTFSYDKLNYSVGEEFKGKLNILADSCVPQGKALLEAEIIDLEGRILFKKSFETFVLSNSTNSAGELKWRVQQEFSGVFCLRLHTKIGEYVGENTYYFSTNEKNPYKAALNCLGARLNSEVAINGDKLQVEIENCGTKAALHINFKDSSDSFLLFPDSSYFTLFPGEKRMVSIVCQKKFVFGFNENSKTKQLAAPILSVAYLNENETSLNKIEGRGC